MRPLFSRYQTSYDIDIVQSLSVKQPLIMSFVKGPLTHFYLAKYTVPWCETQGYFDHIIDSCTYFVQSLLEQHRGGRNSLRCHLRAFIHVMQCERTKIRAMDAGGAQNGVESRSGGVSMR